MESQAVFQVETQAIIVSIEWPLSVADELEKYDIDSSSYSPQRPTKRKKYDEEEGDDYDDWADNGDDDFFNEEDTLLKEDMLLPEIKIEEKDYSTKIKAEPGSVYQYSSAVRIDRSERFVRGVDSIEHFHFWA